MVAGSRRAPSNASMHCLISGSDAHSRSRMAARWRGSAASTAALKTASIRLRINGHGLVLGKGLTPILWPPATHLMVDLTGAA